MGVETIPAPNGIAATVTLNGSEIGVTVSGPFGSAEARRLAMSLFRAAADADRHGDGVSEPS